MNKIKTIGLVLVIVVLFIAGSSFMKGIGNDKSNLGISETTTAKDTVQIFYNKITTIDGESTNILNSFLSASFKKELAELKKAGLSYDPFICASDRPTTIRVEPVVVNGVSENFIATATFTDSSENKMAIKAIKDGKYWAIDKIDCFAIKTPIAVTQEPVVESLSVPLTEESSI